MTNSRQQDFTWSEESALARLRTASTLPGPIPVILVYTRQSVSDFDESGSARGPSLNQQYDTVIRRPEFQGLLFGHFQDADRSGKETSRRPGYLAMMERIRNAAPGEIGAVAACDGDRLHRNAQAFYEFMNECERRHILVFDASGLIHTDDELSWGIKAVVASAERKKTARRVRDNLQHLKRQGVLLGHAPQGYRREGRDLVEDPTLVRSFERSFGFTRRLGTAFARSHSTLTTRASSHRATTGLAGWPDRAR